MCFLYNSDFLVNSGAFLSVNTSRRLHLCATPAVISCYAGILFILKIIGHGLCRVFIVIKEIENFHICNRACNCL